MGSKVQIHYGVFFMAALWLILLPPAWGMGVILAASVHELFHLLAVLLFGGQVLGFSIGPGGASMETTALSPFQEMICVLAGPLGSFTMLLLADKFPEAAICGLVQGVYNLLPIYPLDGGRVLGCLFPATVCRGIEVFFLIFISGVCLYTGVESREIGLIFLLSLWIPVIQRKFSCKRSLKAVQ